MIIIRDNYTLRPWLESDAPTLTYHANNINIWNNLRDRFPHPYLLADAQAYIKLVEKEDVCLNFAIIVEGKAVGGISFTPGKDIERLNAEIGYWLSEDYWRQGVMSAAIKDAIIQIFSATDIVRIFATVFDYNIPSLQVLKKIGFNEVGIMHKAGIKNGKVSDMYHFELVR